MSVNRKSTSMTTAPSEHNPPPMGANPDTDWPDLGEPADGDPGSGASRADDNSPRHVAISGAAPVPGPGAYLEDGCSPFERLLNHGLEAKRRLEKAGCFDTSAFHAMVEEAAMHPDYSFDELGQLCGWRVRKVHAMYGDPSDTTHGWGDDRPLYPELKDRVDTYIEAAFTNLGVLHHDAQRYSSFNALVRAKMRTCEL